MESSSLLIFLYLPKALGSTLARIIERQHAASSVLSLLFMSSTIHQLRRRYLSLRSFQPYA